MWRFEHGLAHARRLRALPALVRDLGAAVVVLLAFGGAEALPAVNVPAASLVLLPMLLLAAAVFGRDSALLAALLAALAAHLVPLGTPSDTMELLPIAVLSGAALGLAALLEEFRRSRKEAASAYLRSDSTARRAAERVELARRQLREAEVRLQEAQRKALQAAAAVAAASRAGIRDPALEAAFRSEGGI